MDVEGLRDWVLIIAGILWMLVTLVVAAIFFFLQLFTRRGFRALDRLFGKKLRPLLATAHTQVTAVRNITSRFPGNTPLPPGETGPARSRGGLALPFRRRRRRLPFGH